jgi:hypothetical protein
MGEHDKLPPQFAIGIPLDLLLELVIKMNEAYQDDEFANELAGRLEEIMPKSLHPGTDALIADASDDVIWDADMDVSKAAEYIKTVMAMK